MSPADGAAPLAREIGEFAASFRLDPARHGELVERVRWHVLDAFGLALSSWTATDGFAHKLLRAHRRNANGGPATIVGTADQASAGSAAFLNGSLVHGSDFDDVDQPTVMHCEGFATAALAALAERDGQGGRELIEAWIITTEVALRFAAAPLASGGLFPSGFHNTAVFGTLGVAAGASRLMGLNGEQTANALALCASFAAGTSVGWLDASGRNKSPQAGWAAQAGLHAADLAAEGYTCSLRTLDAPRGLLDAHAWTAGWSRATITEGLGDDWRTLGLSLKLYPCGAMAQATAECADVLRNDVGIEPDEIEAGRLEIPSQFWQVVQDMGPSLYRPPSGYTLIGAFPCIAARVLLDGYLGLEHQSDEMTADPAMLALADRLTVVADSDHDELPEAERPTTLTLETSRGTLRHTVAIEAGHPSRLTEDRVLDKFRRNAGLVVGAEVIARIEQRVLGLDSEPRIADVMALLRIED